jgi:hypothetical protein
MSGDTCALSVRVVWRMVLAMQLLNTADTAAASGW